MKQVGEFFKVLSDPARLQILWLLLNRDELCVCDIMGTLQVTQSKASRHLATLRHAGLVTDRRDGAWSYYSLLMPSDPLEVAIIEDLRARLVGRADAVDVLNRLDAWLRAKAQDCGCDSGGAVSPDGASCCGGAK